MSDKHRFLAFTWPLLSSSPALCLGLGLGLCLGLGVVPASVADDQSDKATPGFRAEVELVTVDAVVSGKDGAPVVGLTKDDFRVMEDGQPQTLTSFEAVELPAAPAAAATAPAGPPPPPPAVSSNSTADARKARSFALVFDDVHLPPGLSERARSVVAEFLKRSTREGDRVLLASTSGKAWWSEGLEAGRESLLALLATLEGQRILEGSAREQMSDYEALRIYRHQDQDICKRVLRRFVSDGAMMKPGIDELGFSVHCDPTVAMRAQEVCERETDRIRTTLATLRRVMDGMAAAHGRKTVILVSTGFVFDQDLEELRDIVTASRRANAAVYFVDARGLGAGNEQLFQAHHENPDDWGTTDVVQPPAAVQLSEDWQEAEGAVGVAADTGGFSVRNRNDLAIGMGRIADESRAYYLLGYTPRKTARDGKFHKLEVQVSRPDVKVRARKGYYATAGPTRGTPPGELPAEMRQAADAPLAVEGIGLRVSAGVFERGPSGKARVEVVADLALHDITFEQREERHVGTLDVLVRVARLEGGPPESFSETVNLRLRPETFERAQYYPYRKTFDLEAGHYQARLVVRDERGGAVGSVIHDLDVPNLDDWRVASPVLTDVWTTGSAGQTQPTLVAHRDFPSAGTLLCLVEVYGALPDLASGAPRVLLSYTLRRGSEEIAHAEPEPLATGLNGAVGGMFGLSLSALAPGAYDLALQFVDETSGRRQELREPFTVVVPPAGAAAGAGR